MCYKHVPLLGSFKLEVPSNSGSSHVLLVFGSTKISKFVYCVISRNLHTVYFDVTVIFSLFYVTPTSQQMFHCFHYFVMQNYTYK
jgi:hypothetical protein